MLEEERGKVMQEPQEEVVHAVKLISSRILAEEEATAQIMA